MVAGPIGRKPYGPSARPDPPVGEIPVRPACEAEDRAGFEAGVVEPVDPSHAPGLRL